MGLKISDLKPLPNPIYDFTGDSVVPLGVISLPMTLGEYLRQSYVMDDIIDEVPFTHGVGEVKGDHQAVKAA